MPGSSDGFDEAWDQFVSSLRRARSRAASEPGELSLSQYHLLGALARAPELPVGELALNAGVAAPTATRMIDGLVRDGIVERRRSDEDRRVVAIRLTGRGEELLKRKQARVSAQRKVLYESLGPKERREGEKLLRRLAELIEEL